MRILVFFHIAMINHYQEIVEEQVRYLTESGLYDECENIFVGSLGSNEQLEWLKNYIAPYKKIVHSYHSENVLEYEFPTLKLLKDKADSCTIPFYALYHHGKGVTYSHNKEWAYLGGNYWRQHMSYYNITKWKDCVEKLNTGWDTCGVKLLQANDSPAKCLHYSGNFFWIRSDYVKTLQPIESLNTKDRFQAEFWQCSGTEKAASLCQDFVDYNKKGIFQPPQ